VAAGVHERRASAQAKRAGAEVRLARRLAGMSQRDLAARSRVALSTLSRVERGDAAVRLTTLCAIGGAAGLDIVVQAYPGATPRLRDTGQLIVAQGLAQQAHSSWRPALEVPAGDHGRSADLVLFGPTEILHVEIERAPVDLQAQLRAAIAKREVLAAKHQRPVRLVIAIVDTTRNRELVRPFVGLLMGTLPAGSREILSAIRTGRPLGADGLLWVRRRSS
jgi:transcriptional regulator with XRE-family HTH domain